jgi:hypothetical protein
MMVIEFPLVDVRIDFPALSPPLLNGSIPDPMQAPTSGFVFMGKKKPKLPRAPLPKQRGGAHEDKTKRPPRKQKYRKDSAWDAVYLESSLMRRQCVM